MDTNIWRLEDGFQVRRRYFYKGELGIIASNALKDNSDGTYLFYPVWFDNRFTGMPVVNMGELTEVVALPLAVNG